MQPGSEGEQVADVGFEPGGAQGVEEAPVGRAAGSCQPLVLLHGAVELLPGIEVGLGSQFGSVELPPSVA